MQENLKALKKCPGSKITFFKNGKSLGVAFEDIYGGDYYPGVGLFKGSAQRVPEPDPLPGISFDTRPDPIQF